MISAPIRTLGLTDDERDSLTGCLSTWQAKRRKNLLLGVYYDGHRGLQDFGISVPPALKTVKVALGWPQKAVAALARKHVFEGFSMGGSTDPFGVSELLDRNEFATEFVQGVTSAYKHSVSFVTTTAGDTSIGEPEVVIQARDAEWSSALWDKRRRELSAALAITAASELGDPTDVTLYTRDAVIRLVNNLSTWRVVDRQENRTRRVLVEPLVYDPQLSRPFGHSRITRTVRYLTDAAIRTMVRTEVSAEFFSAPQRYIIGAREDAFADMDRWKAVMGRMLALDNNEEGEKPSVGTFSAVSPQPHLEMYRQQAQQFCAETGLPQSSVGLFADNPASAEAMQAAEAALSEEGEYQWRIFTPRLRRIQQNVIMLSEGLSEPPAESWGVNVNWTPCRYVSPQAASDWAVKAAAADETLKGSTVVQRRLGLSQGEIEEVRTERTRASAVSVLDRALGRTAAEPVSDDNPS